MKKNRFCYFCCCRRLAPQRGQHGILMVRILWILAMIGLLLASRNSSAQKGQVVRDQIDSPSLKANLYGEASIRPYMVYLPPSYDHTTNRYPVIYALHGYLDSEALLTAVNEAVPSAIPPFLDSKIAGRLLGEVIVVFVNATNRLYGSFYLNSAVLGDYESYIAIDLVNQIDNSYRTLAARENRGIVGYSMGAWGASHLALKFPNVFSVLVAEAGLYDSQSTWFDRLSRQLAASRPSTLAEFDALNFPNNAVQALFAGLLPNPQRPPLFTDYPYEMVAGHLTTNVTAIRDASERDVQNGDLQRYVAQPLRLTAIKVIHGTDDGVVPISEARNFTNALRIAGIPSAYEQHSSGHIFRADLALPFVVTNLVGAQKYIAPPRLAVARTTNQIGITFSTQTGASDRFHSRP
jgi:S-formylglutathione hydrolase FrmB